MKWDPHKLDSEWPFDVMSTDFELHAESTALIVADMQGHTMTLEPNSPLAPRPDDLIVDKLTSGAFTASLLDHALRNMGIRSVVITGLLTDACVFGTARAAAELGYNSLLCEDACGTYTQRAHDEALLMHARIFGRVDTTEAVMSELASQDS